MAARFWYPIGSTGRIMMMMVCSGKVNLNIVNIIFLSCLFSALIFSLVFLIDDAIR